jgi:hypothetical protein
VAASLADVHLDLLAIHEELAEIAEEEAPSPAPLMEVSLADEGELGIAADAIEAVLVGDVVSLCVPRMLVRR